MSYSRQVKKTIAVHYSGSVSYGPSQNGGTAHYSGTVYEDVVVNVNVDTDPFDASSDLCRHTVDGLTASVTATEAAQVASIKNNSRRVGKTLIDGFFKTVRSEISQQINELKNIVDATLLKLQSDARRCGDMQRQMEVDYNRKCDQYLRIFNELDNELRNRIQNLDQPTFVFRSDADTLNSRLTGSDMVPTVSIAGGENARLGAQLSATLSKQRAYDTLGKARQFLMVHKHTNETINSSIVDSDSQGPLFLPVCYVEAALPDGTRSRSVHTPAILNAQNNQLGESLRGEQWSAPSGEDRELIRRYFNEEVSSLESGNEHGDRVREQIIHLFNN